MALYVPERAAWLIRLPDTLRRVERRWSITAGKPFDSTAAWVAPATLADGTRAVLKLGMPYVQGMLFWNGEPTVQVLKADAR
jgi:streptomycin 6-kinase